MDRWNDQALDQLAETVRALGPAVGQIVAASVKVDALTTALQTSTAASAEEIRRLENQIAAVAQSCGQIQSAQGALVTKVDALGTRELSKMQRTVAWIGAGALVLTTLVSAVATVIAATQ